MKKKQLSKTPVREATGITVRLKIPQLQTKQNNGEQTVITIQKNTNIVAVEGAKEIEFNADHVGKVMDEESIAHNFLNIAKQGDLSPRHIEKVKSAAKGRKKQIKESSTSPTGGVQTRRTLTKSQNQ